MTYRSAPGSFVQSSRKNGLMGRTAVDMVAMNPWGPLVATKQGHGGYWWFVCSAGHESLLDGRRIRRDQRETGRLPRCPTCSECSPAVPGTA